MKKIMVMGAVMLAGMLFLNSCFSNCDCYKTTGCRTLLFVQNTNDSVVAQVNICADSNLERDKTYEQDYDAATNSNMRDGLRIETIDTNLRTEHYETKGFGSVPSDFLCPCGK